MNSLTKSLLCLLLLSNRALVWGGEWAPARGPLATRWAKDVSPKNALPEYPRPQMVRAKWENLNGLWDYAVVAKDASRPAAWDGQILVPFPIESALSGVMKRVSENERLWYRRTFKVPGSWKDQRVRLNFGAVDWQASVWVNGQEVGAHAGGYDAFSFDITEALRPTGEQEIVVAALDPTDAGFQPRGKQVRKPGGIWYTPTTGIWQTVWLEPVNAVSIARIVLVPEVAGSNDQGSVLKWRTEYRGGLESGDASLVDQYSVEVTAWDGNANVASSVMPCAPMGSRFHELVGLNKLWSPDQPFLYDLKFVLKHKDKVVDEVRSYAGMRKIAVAKDADGINRLMLNNQPLFQYGPLDQGFWPDGLYTAPTDEALRYDIEMTKKLGFNMARKHVKIEPDRWYYWCDKLGLLVWQDMPSGDKYIGGRDPDIARSPESARNFETELKALVDGMYNHPSIVMWVPYNEGWGQWDTCRIVDQIKRWDPSRPVINASGWTDRKCGDIHDIHSYPGPAVPPLEDKRAVVLGEFGGLGMPVKGHTWQNEKNWGYVSYKTAEELTEAYLALLDKLHPMTGASGLAAAVYTQTTDVEIEVNGLMTYDRALVKMDADLIAAAAKRLYTPPAKRVAQGTQLVPPATPLVAHDPYFSIWSQGDRLTDVDTTHWTGRPHRLTSLVRIDGKPYRVMGASPRNVPALDQKSLTVLPTRTIYTFDGAGVALTLTFMTPALPEDIDLLSRPVTYVTYDFRSTDKRNHEVVICFDASAELAVNESQQQVQGGPVAGDALLTVKVGSVDQPVLAKRGDDLRIDWGHLYLAAPRAQGASAGLANRSFTHSVLSRGYVPDAAFPPPNPPITGADAVAWFVSEPLKVGTNGKRRWLMLAYDDLYSIQYMRKNLRPYWRRNGWDAADLLKAAVKDYESLKQRCETFDAELMADLTRAGGEKYAKLCALAYRQCFAAGKFVADDNGQPMQFSKENHSNGCIATSDVFYPMAPQFLLLGPSLAKSFLVPFMNYAASERWKFPFAPHDLGTYPHANGQVYGGGERTEENQMPVEESGNLLLLFGAVAQMEGNASFAGLYWPQLEKWAAYLKDKGFDPENQLCTDDFAGHLAHNVNLSAKAICGLGAFAKLCALRGDTAKADEYFKLARELAQRWVKEADDGEKFRLAFDRPNTWSQKYNLMWDRILGLNLFPADVLRKEMDYYKKIQNRYGLPLDNRETYTKLDWITWTATLTQNRADFEALIDPIFTFLNETPDRSPLTDWYQTKTARKVGFTARPVIGGVFARMLYDQAAWGKYAGRDQTKAKDWAPMPKAPVVTVAVPTGERAGQPWRYTTARPAADWFKPEFDDAAWKEGPSGFGTQGTPGAQVRTEWNTGQIWLRREFTLPEASGVETQLYIHHDEDAAVYLNGVLAAQLAGYTTEYEAVPLLPGARSALKPGKNSIAVHCRQTGGGQYIDVGLATVKEVK